jgi:hypothetical protein
MRVRRSQSGRPALTDEVEFVKVDRDDFAESKIWLEGGGGGHPPADVAAVLPDLVVVRGRAASASSWTPTRTTSTAVLLRPAATRPWQAPGAVPADPYSPSLKVMPWNRGQEPLPDR